MEAISTIGHTVQIIENFKLYSDTKIRVYYVNDDESVIDVVYHDIVIVTFNHHNIILNSGGFWSYIIKHRMNEVSDYFRLKFKVYQRNTEYEQDRGATFKANWTVEQSDGTVTKWFNIKDVKEVQDTHVVIINR